MHFMDNLNNSFSLYRLTDYSLLNNNSNYNNHESYQHCSTCYCVTTDPVSNWMDWWIYSRSCSWWYSSSSSFTDCNDCIEKKTQRKYRVSTKLHIYLLYLYI